MLHGYSSMINGVGWNQETSEAAAAAGGGGPATGLLKRFENALDVAERLAPVAKELGCTMAQLAMAWTMANPNVSTAICGATTLEQLKENLGSVNVVAKLTPDVMKKIDEIAGTEPAWDEITLQMRPQRPNTRLSL